MRKPLVIVEHDSEIQEMKKALDAGFSMFDEQLAFIKKQQEESWKALVGVHWEALEDVLKERNLLPQDYSSEKYSIGFSQGVLYVEDKDDDKHSAAKLFDMLFNKE